MKKRLPTNNLVPEGSIRLSINLAFPRTSDFQTRVVRFVMLVLKFGYWNLFGNWIVEIQTGERMDTLKFPCLNFQINFKAQGHNPIQVRREALWQRSMGLYQQPQPLKGAWNTAHGFNHGSLDLLYERP